MNKKYSPTFLVFMLIVILFLLIQDIALITNQRDLLLENTREHIKTESEIISTVARDLLLKRNRADLENFLHQWGQEDEGIVYLTAVSDNGLTLAEYKRNKPAARILQTQHIVSHDNQDLITLKLAHDLSATHQRLIAFSLWLGLTSTFFMLLMGLTLWHLLKKMAITPLEKEILLRIATEDSLHLALDKVERQNAESDRHRLQLQAALAEISSLIQQASKEKTFGVRFYNPNLQKCNEVVSCDDSACPFYGQQGKRCWEEHGPFNLARQGHCCTKNEMKCPQCPAYLEATRDPLYLIGEQFNQMMHILEQKNGELEDAYTELKETQSQILQREKMASIGLLAAGVAHEINNPIGFVTSNLGTLEKYLQRFEEFIRLQANLLTETANAEQLTSLAEQRQKLNLDHITSDAHALITESLDGTIRITNIVRGLKSFSRVDQKEYSEADINECLESTLNIAWNELKYKAEISKEYGDLPRIACYPQQLNQVFMNLLINAAQAITEQGKITIRTWADENYIQVAITDTGTGISKDHLPRIFEPFFTTKQAGSGTGLGLSIAYDIITKEHGGELTVDSLVGQGTTFTVKIPLNRTGEPVDRGDTTKPEAMP